jgi:hypothetical protein
VGTTFEKFTPPLNPTRKERSFVPRNFRMLLPDVPAKTAPGQISINESNTLMKFIPVKTSDWNFYYTSEVNCLY